MKSHKSFGDDQKMQYKEYGSDKAETVFLLHGGGLSWWNYKDEAKLLQSSYHVILPILDGHHGAAGTVSRRVFHQSAEQIHTDDHGNA